MAQNLKDLDLKASHTLPNGAATTYSTGIDLGAGGNLDDLVANVEFLLSAPALNTTQQPNAKTIIYSVQTDSDAAFGTVADVQGAILTQTGAGGVGCAAATKRFRLPSDVLRYVRIKAVGSASGDASGATATLEPVF